MHIHTYGMEKKREEEKNHHNERNIVPGPGDLRGWESEHLHFHEKQRGKTGKVCFCLCVAVSF